MIGEKTLELPRWRTNYHVGYPAPVSFHCLFCFVFAVFGFCFMFFVRFCLLWPVLLIFMACDLFEICGEQMPLRVTRLGKKVTMQATMLEDTLPCESPSWGKKLPCELPCWGQSCCLSFPAGDKITVQATMLGDKVSE